MTSELKLVEIETHLGSIYRFPDYLGNVNLPSSFGVNSSSFVVANVSGSALTIPFRVIKKVLVDGEVIWTGPTQFAA
jgi:hypothetical protein